MKEEEKKEITNHLPVNPFEGWNPEVPMNDVPEMVESQYSRTFNAEYNYEPEANQLFTEEVPTVPSKKNSSKKRVNDKKDAFTKNEEGNFPKVTKPRYQKNWDEDPFERISFNEYHHALNYEDFYDVDEYLLLADERAVITHEELIKCPEKPPKHTGYECPKVPIEFIGRLNEIRSLNDNKGRRRHYCFVTLGLDKYKLVAFLKNTGAYSPSYDEDIDLTNSEIGSYWYCKAGLSSETKKMTWCNARELKAPCLRDIFQNPDPKFRPKGWRILNDKIIFDSNLIKGKPEADFEEFKITIEEGKTPKYYGTLEGLLG